jgi:hypothetical protein
MKLKIKLTLIISILMGVVVAVVAILLLTTASRMQTNAAKENMQNLTGYKSRGIENEMEIYLDILEPV